MALDTWVVLERKECGARQVAAMRLAKQQRANLKKVDSAVAAAGVGPPQKKKSGMCAFL